jgi:DNA-binding response OmpR family regulator
MARKARILVVDGSRPTVIIISSVLKKEGFDVFTAYDGHDALKLAADAKPDLIILDVMIPGMDGYEVCYHLKKDQETQDIAVLFLTVKGDVDAQAQKQWQFAGRVQDRLRGLDLGAVDYLSKPIQAKDLAKRVRALLWSGGFPISL